MKKTNSITSSVFTGKMAGLALLTALVGLALLCGGCSNEDDWDYNYPIGDIKIADAKGTPLYILQEDPEPTDKGDRFFGFKTNKDDDFYEKKRYLRPTGLFVNTKDAYYYYSDSDRDGKLTIQGYTGERDIHDEYWKLEKKDLKEIMLAPDQIHIEEAQATIIHMSWADLGANTYFEEAQDYLDDQKLRYEAELAYVEDLFKEMISDAYSTYTATSDQVEAEPGFRNNSVEFTRGGSGVTDIQRVEGEIWLGEVKDTLAPRDVRSARLKVTNLGGFNYTIEWDDVYTSHAKRLTISGGYAAKDRHAPAINENVKLPKEIYASFEPENGPISTEIYEYSLMLLTAFVNDYHSYEQMADDEMLRRRLEAEKQAKEEKAEFRKLLD